MKSFALVLFAAAVSAIDSEHGSSGFTYARHQPAQSYYNKPQQSYARSGSYAPTYTATKGYQTTPQQFGYGYAAPNYSSSAFYHQPNHAHNPFEYSRPQIPYVAAKLSAPVYASCYVTDGSNYTIELKFGQLPGPPIQVQSTYSDLSNTWTDGDLISHVVHKYGDVSGSSCANVGDVYNPLQDPHNTTPETRGTLEDVSISADVNDITTSTQSTFEQNLGGLNSLIGRSIQLSDDDPTDLGCCVIGLDAPPAPAA